MCQMVTACMQATFYTAVDTRRRPPRRRRMCKPRCEAFSQKAAAARSFILNGEFSGTPAGTGRHLANCSALSSALQPAASEVFQSSGGTASSITEMLEVFQKSLLQEFEGVFGFVTLRCPGTCRFIRCAGRTSCSLQSDLAKLRSPKFQVTCT